MRNSHSGTVLITGASRGIGAATARLFAQHGYRVCINYRIREDRARALQEDIRAAGGHAIILRADVRREDEVGELFAACERELGPIDVLVNNAGVLHAQTSLREITLERFNAVLAGNLLTCFLCCREAVRRMSTVRGGRGGSIVNVSSTAARTGSPHEYVDYAAAKGGVDSLTRGLALEVAREGIRVNAVRPGLIHTEIHADGGEAGRVERLRHKLPLGRGGQPEEVAEAIFWLASDKASFTTGGFIDLAGGL